MVGSAKSPSSWEAKTYPESQLLEVRSRVTRKAGDPAVAVSHLGASYHPGKCRPHPGSLGDHPGGPSAHPGHTVFSPENDHVRPDQCSHPGDDGAHSGRQGSHPGKSSTHPGQAFSILQSTMSHDLDVPTRGVSGPTRAGSIQPGEVHVPPGGVRSRGSYEFQGINLD